MISLVSCVREAFLPGRKSFLSVSAWEQRMGSSSTGGPAVQSPQPEWSGWRDHRFALSHQFMVPLPLFPSSVFAGTRPHPWSSLEPSSSPSYCCEFSKCCSCRFSPPRLFFQACAPMVKRNTFFHSHQHIINKVARMAKCRQPQEGTER